MAAITMIEEATALVRAGISVVPCDPATKKAVVTWAPYQDRTPTEVEVKDFFKNGNALAVIGGTVSGNLEVIDFDEPGLVREWKALLTQWNCGPLLNRLVIESSQKKGRFHIAYRHQGKPEGNQKLAMKTPSEVRIETRGQGGYCVIAPTPGYSLKQGSWTNLPIITAEEREALLAAARTFDECPKEYSTPADKGGVIGAYNAKASVSEILEPLGWTRVNKYWTRPGKEHKDGHSATWDHNGSKKFFVFSSNAGIPLGRHDLFDLYMHTVHGGDFGKALAAARLSGYGESPRETVQRVTGDTPTKPTYRLLSFDDVEEEPIQWLWEPRISAGVVSMIQGNPGSGKSTLAVAVASDLSKGWVPATKGREKCEPVKTILLSSEDSKSQVIKPRLRKLNSAPGMIFYPEADDEDGKPIPMVLDDAGIEALEVMIREANAGLCIIDPILAYIGSVVDINKANEVRRWMRALGGVADNTGCAVLLLHHLNKGLGGLAIYRGVGSIDFVGSSRSVMMTVKDPEDESNNGLAHIKVNGSRKGATIGYTVSDDGTFEWTGDSDLTPEMCERVAEIKVTPKQKDGCCAWIESQLANGPMRSKDLYRGARECGYSDSTVKRAKASMSDVIARKLQDGTWEWRLDSEVKPWAR